MSYPRTRCLKEKGKTSDEIAKANLKPLSRRSHATTSSASLTAKHEQFEQVVVSVANGNLAALERAIQVERLPL